MFEILTVGTGDVCRAPAAALILTARLDGLSVHITSAGTRALPGMPMTRRARRLATTHGATWEAAAAHRSHRLTGPLLRVPELILTMTLDERAEVAELDRERVAATFTVREFARLASAVGDAQLQDAAAAGSTVHGTIALAAAQRGRIAPVVHHVDDDVISPFRGSRRVYRQCASQLVPALEQVIRIVRAGL